MLWIDAALISSVHTFSMYFFNVFDGTFVEGPKFFKYGNNFSKYFK